MSEKFNATCAICGKPYKICRTCQEIESFTPWRTVTDTLQHYAIFLALSELDTFNENIKNMILDITKEEVVDEKPQIDENVNIEPQKFIKKNNSRKKYEATNDDIE